MNREDTETYALGLYGAVGGVYKYYVKPNPAVAAWGCLAASVTAYDVWALSHNEETMSHAFNRAWENPNPIYKFMCAGLIGALAVHLCHSVRPQLLK